jgi:hypothetical protein
MLAKTLNPKIRGWINYYTRFRRSEGLQVFNYLNEQIRIWIARKYKIRYYYAVVQKYKTIQEAKPQLFYHWQQGVK